MNQNFFKHYITTDPQHRIVGGFSDAFRAPTAADTLLADKGGYQFRLSPDGEENPQLATMDGVPLFKFVGGTVTPRTAAELAADRATIPAPPPTAEERLRADVDFLAAMGGVAL